MNSFNQLLIFKGQAFHINSCSLIVVVQAADLEAPDMHWMGQLTG